MPTQTTAGLSRLVKDSAFFMVTAYKSADETNASEGLTTMLHRPYLAFIFQIAYEMHGAVFLGAG